MDREQLYNEGLNKSANISSKYEKVLMIEDELSAQVDKITELEINIEEGVLSAIGEDGKPLYTNDKARKNAVMKRKAADLDFIAALDHEREIRRRHRMARLDLEEDQRTFSLIKAYLHGS